MLESIKVSYKHTNSAYKANQFLQEIKQSNLFAADFEAAIKYTDEELESFKQELENNPIKRRRIELESTLKATALDHPSHVDLTHCSIALNDHEAYVFILDNPKITDLVTNFLVTTKIKQIWHNASYDFKHLLYHTGKMPIDYEDSQILAKTILNHSETWKANTSLKELAGKWYGDWAISADNFNKKQMYEEHVLRYAGTDACATFKLWESINNYLKEQ
ncbi:MAG: hypothetical protein BV456_13420 [Thermoplasmata archaeon M8B2D]|nr:MAG: hypothetical protein BV456_13420 [Thermoplasmata archaeon M8B2D]